MALNTMTQLPRAMLIDMDDTILSAYGRPEIAWNNVAAEFAGEFGPLSPQQVAAAVGQLVEAATGGEPRFFLGTDSAPHARHTKENACGCAGMYSAHAGIELYAEAFDAAGALPRLEGFAHAFGADFYGLPRNAGTITLRRAHAAVPASFRFGADEELVPMRAGGDLLWTLATP